MQGGTLTTNNATIELTGSATFNFTGQGTVNMTAPTTGTMQGIAVFGFNQTSNLNSTFAGGSKQTIIGAVYLPTQNITYSRRQSSPPTKCIELVAYTIDFTGSANFALNCVGHPMPTIGGEQVTLVE